MEVPTLILKAALEYWPHAVGAVVSFFLLRMITGWDTSIKDVLARVCIIERSMAASAKVLASSEQIVNEWALMRKGISDAEAMIRQAGEKLESISYLKRDSITAFKRIDEIRETLQVAEKQLVERCHLLSNRLTAMRQAMESHDIPVEFD